MKLLASTEPEEFERVYQCSPIRSTVAKLVQKTCFSTESYGKYGKLLEDQKKSFVLSTNMSFHYDSDRKGTILAEEYIDGLIKYSFSIMRKITTSVSFASTKTYDLKVPINKKKTDNLKRFQDSILEEHMPFYSNISGWPTAKVEDNPEENDGEYNYIPYFH
ncbi:hypothetical protein WA026_019802 [Henosepilachna vigintioctopunctata]|uniref:EF-hand domain-containing protein n=1 Tax=Henosepilachna vigintioctopunctata TaxID=420089 RepID=A0AAW1VF48_9CUCU